MQTIVIGHKNPDMDSICSAVAYAELKRLSGHTDVIAARAGNTNERIDFVLGKFGVAAPVLINDLSPVVGDVMEPRVFSVRADSPVYDAIQLIEKKQAEKNDLDTKMSTEDIIRDREELSEQIRALKELQKMAQTYGFDISGPAHNARQAVHPRCTLRPSHHATRRFSVLRKRKYRT